MGLRLRRVLAGGVGLVIATLACGDSGTGPNTLTVVVTPSTAEVQAGDTVRLTATLQDASGGPQQVSSISWSSSDSRIGTVSESGLVTGGAAGGPVTITATVNATSGRATVTVTPGDPAALSIQNQPSTTGASGVALDRQPVVQVTDALGNAVSEPDLVVTATLAEGTGSLFNATATTDASGRATFSGLAVGGSFGDYRLSFEIPGLDPSISDVVTLDQGGAPAAVTIVTQPSPNAQSGAAFSQQPAVGVTDEWGNPVGRANVTASIASGGGTIGGTLTASTDASGEATFTDLSLAGPVGDHTLSFTAGAESIESATIVLGVGAPASVTIVTQPSSTAQYGVALTQQPAVDVRDSGGNPVEGAQVGASIASGGGTLGGGTTVTTDGTGRATFTNLSITGALGVRTLGFESATGSATSQSVELTAGPPASLTVTTQPSSVVQSAVAFPRQPVVVATDGGGNPSPGYELTVAIGSGGGSLGGTTTISTNGSGTATFSNLSISTSSPGPRTLHFASGGEEAVSDSVHVGYGQGTYTDVQYCGSMAAQRMDVSIPLNVYTRPLPVAAYVHGGSWVSGTKDGGTLLDEVRAELLMRGYVVVSLEYRLATETTNQWPAQIEDVKCAIRHLRAEKEDYGVDGVRIGVWGHSAGGHLVSMLGVTDGSEGFEGSGGYPGVSSRVEAVAALGGISDLTQGPDHTELDFFGPEWAFSTWAGPSPELTDASPITWASSDDPPFLIVHGTEDTLVDSAQAQRLFDELDGVGANATLQFVTNGSHSLSDSGGTASPSKAELATLIADFLDTHVRFVS